MKICQACSLCPCRRRWRKNNVKIMSHEDGTDTNNEITRMKVTFHVRNVAHGPLLTRTITYYILNSQNTTARLWTTKFMLLYMLKVLPLNLEIIFPVTGNTTGWLTYRWIVHGLRMVGLSIRRSLMVNGKETSVDKLAELLRIHPRIIGQNVDLKTCFILTVDGVKSVISARIICELLYCYLFLHLINHFDSIL